jgi:zinc transport system permease protein
MNQLAIALIYPFESEFMVRALVAAVILGFCAPLIGTFVVQRKLSLVGDGLGHVAAAGVGLALWLDFAPQWVALIATVFAAIMIEWIFHLSKSTDTALAIIFYSGIAASITFAGKSANQGQLQQYLFGSLLSVTWLEIILLAAICLIASLAILLLSKVLLSIAIDESSAKIAGINTHIVHVILMCSVAFIVSVSMSITGLLLVSAVMVVPVMTSRLMNSGFYRAWISSALLGVFGTVLGLGLSRVMDLAPGGTIVLTHVGLFIFVSLIFSLLHQIRRSDREHDHVHPIDEPHTLPMR